MHKTETSADALEAMLQLDHPAKLAASTWATEHLGSGVNRETWKAAAGFGIQGSCTPVALGGSGASAVDLMLMFEGLGHAGVDTGFVFGVASQVVTVERALAQSGTAAQHGRWLNQLISGDIFACFAMTEPTSGSDPWAMRSTAVEQSDGSFLLNGTKAWLSLGSVADLALVFALTNPDVGHWGVSAFLVPTDSPGVEVGANVSTTGMDSLPWGGLTFNDVRVEEDQVLGKVGSGAAIFTSIVEAERALLYAPLVGASERLIDRTVERARQRRQGGTHIGGHQAVSHRIVGMKQRHEAARLMLYKAAAVAEQGQPLALTASLAKLQASEVGPATAIDAMHTFGAAGFASETELDIVLRDALAGLSFSATSDIARNIVASELRLNRPAR